jgi:hypothetical protein
MKQTSIIIALSLLGLAAPAQADPQNGIGIGLFVGQPTGLDLKIGLQRLSALDIVLGAADYDNGRGRLSYGHLTYLVRIAMGRGESVSVPVRLGIGGAIIGATENDAVFAARVPLQIGLRFRQTPLEIYGEVAFMLYFVDPIETGVDGGVGIRVYF